MENKSPITTYDLKRFSEMISELYSDSDFIKLKGTAYNLMSNKIIPALIKKYEDIKNYLKDKPQNYILKMSDTLTTFSVVTVLYHTIFFECDFEDLLYNIGITEEAMNDMIYFLQVLLCNIDGFDSDGWYIKYEDFAKNFIKARENTKEFFNVVSELTTPDEELEILLKYDPFIEAIRRSMPDEAKIFDDQESA